MAPQTPAGRRAAAKRRRSPGDQSPGKTPDSQGKAPDSPGNQSPGNQSAPEGSPASSPASAAAGSSPFLSNAGRPFEGRESGPPASAGQQPGAGAELAPPILAGPWWDRERAEKVLRAQGALTHSLAGVAEDDWQWRQAELDAVAPPLADGFNRVELLRRLAPYADVIGGIGGLVAYVQRSRLQRREALAQRRPVEQPVTGQDAGELDWRPAGESTFLSPPVSADDSERAARRAEALDSVMALGRERESAGDAGEDVDWRIE